MQTIPDDINLDDYLEGPDESGFVRSSGSYTAQVIKRFHGSKERVGEAMGWKKTHDNIRFRPAEVTLWAGINGHGKSLVTGQVAIDLMVQESKVCIASFEMLPVATLARMNRQASGDQVPSMEFIERFGDWTNSRLWMYDVAGNVKPQRVLACGRYAATLGVRHFFIDSLMKCVKGEDDFNGQKDFVNDVCNLARETGMHIHLIHHIRKGEDEHKTPGKQDVKGSGSITDQVDNVVIVWRNKRKERAQQEGRDYDYREPDACLIVEKQRNGEWEGKIGLWFHALAQQFLEHGNQTEPRRYFE